MDAPDQSPDAEKRLSDEELRALAHRHGLILRRFRARRERYQREQQAVMYAWAHQMASMSVSTAPVVPPVRSEISPPQPATPVASNAPVPVAAKASDSAKPTHEHEEAHSTVSISEVVKIGGDEDTEPLPEESPLTTWSRQFGGGSLVFSLAFHALLILFALFWVVSNYAEVVKPPEEFFATGSGGGRGGDRPSYADVQASRRKSGKIGAGQRTHKIVSKSTTSGLVLPEMPSLKMSTVFSGDLSSAGARSFGGALSSGSGGGLGGGVGAGFGAGIGNARNYVGKFKTTQKVLGTDVTADRLAVYMDSSGSMTSVMPVVRKEITSKFPTADVYEFMGCGMGSFPEEYMGTDKKSWEREKKRLLRTYDKEKKGKKPKSRSRSRKQTMQPVYGDESWRALLSSYGAELLSRWSPGGGWFDMGSWINMNLIEGDYDTLIVFADFQDYRDGMLPDEAEILDRWISLARKNKQRLYFFTTEMMPQSIFLEMARATGGDIAIPKRIAKQSFSADQTAKEIKRWSRNKNKSFKIKDDEEEDFDGNKAPAEDEFEDEEDNLDEGEDVLDEEDDEDFEF